MAVVAANVLAHPAWVGLLYLAATWLTSPRAALISALLLALNPMILTGYNLNGHPDVLFGASFLAFNLLFFMWIEEPSKRPLALAVGAAAGLCYLARYNFTLLAVPYLLAPLWAPRIRARRLEAGLVLIGAAALILPWSLYNRSAMGGGSPPLFFWSLAGGTIASGLPWSEYRAFNAADFLRPDFPAALARKWAWLFLNFLREAPTFWNCLALWPFSFWAIFKLPPGRARFFFRFLAGVLLWNAVCFSFLRHENLGWMNGRYYLWYLPVLLLSAAACLENLLARRGARIWVSAALAATLALWLRAPLQAPRSMDHYSRSPVGSWPEILQAADWPKDAWVLTNLPAQLTWYAGLKTVLLPYRLEDVERIQKDYPIESIYLHFHRVAEWRNFPEWNALLESPEAFESFFHALGYRVTGRNAQAVLLQRRRPA